MKGTLIALEMKSFGPPKIKLHAGVKSAILAIFQKEPGWPFPVSTALKNPSHDLEKYFWFGFL